ncbi:hypothetical protein HMPREF1868_00442 [Olsenella sp. DNF00959]|nr:hypothetical protein HMPREF1868_00442 [Olsenella sp. DNF00959]
MCTRERGREGEKNGERGAWPSPQRPSRLEVPLGGSRTAAAASSPAVQTPRLLPRGWLPPCPTSAFCVATSCPPSA